MDRAHLTLRFLGELPTPTPELSQTLRPLLDASPPFALELGSPGAFGGRSPQVLWLGVRGAGLEVLSALGERLARAPGLGAPERRPFRPHLTLARVRRRERIERGALEEAWAGLEVHPRRFEVREAVLFSSNAGRRGPLRHEVLARFPLGAAPSSSPAPAPRPAPPPQVSDHLATYLEHAAAKPPPSRAAHRALAAAAREALEHARAWPPDPEAVSSLLRERGPAAQARATRRLAERAPLEARRVRQGLEDARRRVEELLEEAEEDPASARELGLREAEAWVARHGLPERWFQEEAARVGLSLGEPLQREVPTRPTPSSATSPADAIYREALASVWREDALFLGRRAASAGSPADLILEVRLARAPRAAELASLGRGLSEGLGRPLRILDARSLGGGARRLRLAWGEAPAESSQGSPPPPARPAAEPERETLLARLGAQEPERHARRDFLLGESPRGEPALLRELLDRAGRADLACWAGPWKGRTHVALLLGERALERGLSAGVLLREVLRPLGGAGGGSPRLAEGACPADSEAVVQALRTWVLAGGLS